MPKLLLKIPDQIVRLGIVFLALIGLIAATWLMLPPSLKEKKLQRAEAVERERAREVKYAGAAACALCHGSQYAKKKAGYHRTLSCETCHGPAQAHTTLEIARKGAGPRFWPV